MTSLIAWVAVDGRGTSALYFASDSRLTWSPERLEWSFGRKLFASRSTSDIFGYCGDVLFPSLLLGQVESLLNSSFLFAGGEPLEDRHKGFVRMIQISFKSYPIRRRAEGVVVDNGDIAAARVVQGDAPSKYDVDVKFKASGAEKILTASGNHIGKPVAILLDGQVVMAPVVRSPIGASAVVTGNFTKAQAERIVKGIGIQ